MTEERLVIEPPIQGSHRFGGFLLLGIISLMLNLFGWVLMFGAPRVQSHELNQVRFICAMLGVFEVVVLGFGARLAFETQTWIAGRD